MTAPTAAAKIPSCVVEQHRAGDDADVVEDRREGVEQEPPLGDEDLAERDRGREQDRREQHQPEQVEVEGLRLRVEAGGDDARPSPGRGRTQDAAGRAITPTASVSTVWANRGAASTGSLPRSVVNTGTNGAVRPAATRTSRAAPGSTKAAL